MSSIVDISNVHTIGAGWWIDSTKHDDNYAHFGVFWADIRHHKECFNLKCPGFIQVSTKIAVGARLSPVSTYDGKQYSLTTKLFRDEKTGNWWVTLGQNDEPIGYWPKVVIPKLANNAFYAVWCGETSYALKNHVVPPMGSGHYPSEGYGKSAFFSNILVANKENKLEIPDTYFLWDKITKTDCYGLGGVMKSKTGLGFFFGGPGGC